MAKDTLSYKDIFAALSKQKITSLPSRNTAVPGSKRFVTASYETDNLGQRDNNSSYETVSLRLVHRVNDVTYGQYCNGRFAVAPARRLAPVL